MVQPDSDLRLLFATEAYSMGTDAPDIRRIVHAGPPHSLESEGFFMLYKYKKQTNNISMWTIINI